MSFPPKYERLQDIDAQVPWRLDQDPRDEPLIKGFIPGGTSYPPGPCNPNTIVTYTFVPRYPVKGDKAYALGVVGNSRLVRIHMQTSIPQSSFFHARG